MTTSLRATHVELLAAPLGEENPLPQLWPADALHDLVDVPPSLAERVRYGWLTSVLPCLAQDGYSRSRTPARIPALVLENDRLRATVLPGLGGRLHSLVYVPTGRELLYRNPALQPANLALRNAWFAGGVEWNLGSTGHTTLTCSPMHAAAVPGPDGTPILRLWEWERTRNLPYQLDFWLPAGVDALLVGVRVRNPHREPVPAYWWSNLAVTAAPGVRVLVPATSAWRFGYSRRVSRMQLSRVPVPVCDGVDVTDPSAHQHAVDLFFELPEGQRPWIAAVDASGLGVAHMSSSRLRGRKLFVWGQSAGGRRWQEWLSPESPSPGYFEIQAGLATTQLEHLPMPAGAAWHWLEAYVPVDLCGASSREPWGSSSSDTWASHVASYGTGDAQASGEVARRGTWNAHVPWDVACGAVEAALDAGLPPTVFERAYAGWLPITDAMPEQDLFTGSGWGALELERARRFGSPIDLPGTPFLASTMDSSQQPWLSLLDGSMPDAEPPGGTLVSPPWRELLERAADGWLVCYHRGVARWYAGDQAGAIAAWRRSVDLRPSAWALRNIAMAAPAGDRVGAAELMRAALDMRPNCLPLRIETVRALLAAGRPADALELLAGHRSHGGCQLLRAQALLALGDAAGAQAVFDAGFDVADLREGEHTLTELWSAVQHALGTERPLPPRYDFSMSSSR